LNLINNTFNEIREIECFSKEEIVKVKRRLEHPSKDSDETGGLEGYLNTIFMPEIISSYSSYLTKLRTFTEAFLIKSDGTDALNPTDYCYLKTAIINELNLLLNNINNLKSNGRNTKRFLKDKGLLEEFLAAANQLSIEITEIISKYEQKTKIPEESYNNYVLLWQKINFIKNMRFVLNALPTTLQWGEIMALYDHLKSINEEEAPVKKKERKKDHPITFHFKNASQFYSQKKGEEFNLYVDLMGLLYQNDVFEEIEDKFQNIIERKEISKQLKLYLHPILKKLVGDKLGIIIEEIIELGAQFELEEGKKPPSNSSLLEGKFSIILPKLVDFYFNGLEKKYQSVLINASDSAEFKNIASFYSEKIYTLSNKLDEIHTYIDSLEPTLAPYQDITISLKHVFSNLNDEITRRKEEYLYYLKTIKNERLRDSIRNYVSSKINQINELITKYQDETSLIIREEFPQLKQIREILRNYNKKVLTLKDEVYKKLEQYKEKEIDIYQLIKQWEENFNRKQQQLNFLLSLLLNKLYKGFKELIESEDMMLENISEISKASEEEVESSVLPLNYALSDFLADKLNGKELEERIAEVKLKINKLNQEISLYQGELSKLEDFHGKRVRIREGITSEKVQCGVCHKHIAFAKDKIIKCPFCDNIYHYLCVAFWLSKYNSCPSCQNQFLDPNLGMFEDHPE